MDEQFTTFDTFSVGDYAPEPPNRDEIPIRVLARLPQVKEAAARSKKQRYDTPDAALSGVHYGVEFDTVTSEPVSSLIQPSAGDPTVTLRIDTVGFDSSTPDIEPLPSGQSAYDRSLIGKRDQLGSLDANDELTGWLLRAEAVVLPYSRWIVLAAVLAGLGLTLVLLRGGTSGNALELPSSGPNAGVDLAESLLVAGEISEAPAIDSLAGWPKQSLNTPEQSLRPLEAQITGEPTASGPVSAPQSVRLPRATLPRAELIGRVEAPENQSTVEERIEIATRPSTPAYPSTSVTGFGGAPGSFK